MCPLSPASAQLHRRRVNVCGAEGVECFEFDGAHRQEINPNACKVNTYFKFGSGGHRKRARLAANDQRDLSLEEFDGI